MLRRSTASFVGRASAVVLVVLLSGVMVAPLAHADDDQAGGGGRLAPGYSMVSDAFNLSNPSASTAGLRLQAVHVRDLENGCVAPEVRAGDSTCGTGGGELSRWLEIEVSAQGGGAPGGTIWSGTFETLTAGVSVSTEVPAGADWQIALVQRLPRQSGNDTMTDSVEYDLRWTLTAVNEERGGEPPLIEDGSVLRQSFPGLPTTGTSVTALMLTVGAALVAGGVTLVLLAWRRRIAAATDRQRSTS